VDWATVPLCIFIVGRCQLVSELIHLSKIYDNIAKPLSSNTSKIYNDDDTFQDSEEISLNRDKMDSKVKCKMY